MSLVRFIPALLVAWILTLAIVHADTAVDLTKDMEALSRAIKEHVTEEPRDGWAERWRNTLVHKPSLPCTLKIASSKDRREGGFLPAFMRPFDPIYSHSYSFSLRDMKRSDDLAGSLYIYCHDYDDLCITRVDLLDRSEVLRISKFDIVVPHAERAAALLMKMKKSCPSRN